MAVALEWSPSEMQDSLRFVISIAAVCQKAKRNVDNRIASRTLFFKPPALAGRGNQSIDPAGPEIGGHLGLAQPVSHKVQHRIGTLGGLRNHRRREVEGSIY